MLKCGMQEETRDIDVALDKALRELVDRATIHRIASGIELLARVESARVAMVVRRQTGLRLFARRNDVGELLRTVEGDWSSARRARKVVEPSARVDCAPVVQRSWQADAVETIKPETDRILKTVAARAGSCARERQDLFARGPARRRRRHDGIHPGRRRRNVLAEEVCPDRMPALRRRRFVGTGMAKEERAQSQKAAARRSCAQWYLRENRFGSGKGQPIKGSKGGVDERVIGGEKLAVLLRRIEHDTRDERVFLASHRIDDRVGRHLVCECWIDADVL